MTFPVLLTVVLLVTVGLWIGGLILFFRYWAIWEGRSQKERGSR